MQKKLLYILLITGLASLTGCTSSPQFTDGPPHIRVDANKIPNAVPRPLPKSRYGNPRSYVVYGKRYYVLPSANGYDQRGIASWYGTKFHGQLTSTRKPYNMFAMTAASPVLPIPCFVRVTNLQNGREVIVKVNDRGPFAPNRIIDLSYVAAEKLGYIKTGTALVQVTGIDTTRSYAPRPIILTRRPELYLQVGSFTNFANAEELKQHISHYTKKHIRINTAHLNDRILYRVQIGPLIGVGESDRLQHVLAHRGLGDAVTIIS
ncbi:MAG: septal ring lytic transglycosylase RlpA family protein [Gammaproteobacteria bacterium]|nr:septal ring lytic transglycosylase RlpA family protein [Gammaproteobacteria bacterium]MCH9744700.1 septal ring lytic transglycosylase RlpA family protein [Gammaproteobacteria bacterium]